MLKTIHITTTELKDKQNLSFFFRYYKLQLVRTVTSKLFHSKLNEIRIHK